MSRAPYKYLDYYTFEDADLFFGREEETQRMVGEILSTRLLVLFSPSGSGKTSLINAGVRPQLENMGYKTIYTRLETEPISSVCNAVARALEIPCNGNIQSLYEFLKTVTSRTEKPVVIFLDQFEEFFTVFREQHEKRKEFIDQLAKIKYDDHLPVFVVLSLREDYFVNLHEFREAIPSIFQNNANLRLEPFTDEEARRAIMNPLKAKDIDASIDDELVSELIKDLKDSTPGIEPIKLQIVCHTLWEKKPKGADQITYSDYRACEGANAILSHHVQNLLNKIPKRQHGFIVRIFEALKTEDDTKRFRSLAELQKKMKIKNPERLATMLDKFSNIHILRFEEKERTKWYEFKHDYLVGEITTWMQRRKDQLAKKRFRYAVAPGIILALLLLIWSIFEFNRFEARFTDQDYDGQQQEVFVKRRFNPFGFQVTTGILYYQLKDHDATNAINNGFTVSVGNKNNWCDLAKKMDRLEAGIFLYRIGEYCAGIDTLIKEIKNVDWYGKCRAAEVLVNLGQTDDKVITALLRALNAQDGDIRYQAAIALVKLGKENDKITSVLLCALSDQSYSIRSQAANALGNLGKANDRVIEALMSRLKDQASDVRSEAALALGNLGKANDHAKYALVTALNTQNWSVIYRSIDALRNLGKTEDLVTEVLVVSLNDQFSYVRSRAAALLGILNKGDDRVLNALRTTLNDQNFNVRLEAACALVNLGKTDDVVIDALVGTLKNKDRYIYSQAAATLANLGKANDRAFSELVQALNDQPYEVSLEVVVALGNLSLVNVNVISALVAATSNQYWSIRIRAAAALVNLGNTDDYLIDDLVAALNDQVTDIRNRATVALGNLSKTDDRVINALVSVLKDHDWNIRRQAVAALANLSKTNNRAIATLVAALKDRDWNVRYQAATALANLGKADDHAITSLIAALKHPYSLFKADSALGIFFKYNSREKLFKYLEDDSSGYRTAGAQALARQDSITDYILEKVNRMKDKDKRPWVRLGAWEAYELIQKRLEEEKTANQFIHKADSLFQINKFWESSTQYQSAFDQLTKIIRIDSLKIVRTKFQQARCTARMNRLIPTLDHLEIAFQYDKNKAWRDTLIAELAQKGSGWELMKDNWYLNEVLLKNSKSQITNSK